MHILVTNDDGITAPGLAALAGTLREVGRITVMAPERNWSASGHVKTMHKPLRVFPATLADGTDGLATTGAPSDCVALALLGAVSETIDLVVSGINPNANIGHDITYSGTVTAAMEAVICGVPGIAVSAERAETTGYGAAANAAARLSRAVASRGLPPKTLLNVNVPALPEERIRGIQVTTQSDRAYDDELIERLDPRGQPYYWITGQPAVGAPDEGTDARALADGYVSVTPLQLDLTAHVLLEQVREWFADT